MDIKKLYEAKTLKDAWRFSVRTNTSTPMTQEEVRQVALQGTMTLALACWVLQEVSKAGADGGDQAAIERLHQLMLESSQLAHTLNPSYQAMKAQ